MIDIAREGLLARLDALEERRQAGIAKGTARPRRALEDGDRIALGNQRGIVTNGSFNVSLFNTEIVLLLAL